MMNSEQNEFDQTRNAMFEVRQTVFMLEKASKPMMHADPEIGHNFKRIMLEELDIAIQMLSVVRSRLENI
jgi:hypothetical protein